VEGLVLVVMGTTGIIVETVVAQLVRPTPHLGVANIQHATMYGFFAHAGVVCLVSHRLQSLRIDADSLKYAAFVLAFGCEALLFRFHTNHSVGVDYLEHTLLLYTAYAVIVAFLLEMRHRDNIVFALCRAGTMMLHGSWFWQLSFDLYKDNFKAYMTGKKVVYPYEDMDPKEEHKLMLFIVCKFTWYIAAIILLIVVTGVGLHRCYGNNHGTRGYAQLAVNQLESSRNEDEESIAGSYAVGESEIISLESKSEY